MRQDTPAFLLNQNNKPNIAFYEYEILFGILFKHKVFYSL